MPDENDELDKCSHSRVEKMLTYQRLRELLDYEPQTGKFFWKVRTARCVKIGSLAGAIERNGYRRIDLLNKHYLAHRLAWLYVNEIFGEFARAA